MAINNRDDRASAIIGVWIAPTPDGSVETIDRKHLHLFRDIPTTDAEEQVASGTAEFAAMTASGTATKGSGSPAPLTITLTLDAEAQVTITRDAERFT